MRNIKISPSILSADFNNLEKEVRSIEDAEKAAVLIYEKFDDLVNDHLKQFPYLKAS